MRVAAGEADGYEKGHIASAISIAWSTGGHSSIPVADNAIYHLAGALARLSSFGFPLKTTM